MSGASEFDATLASLGRLVHRLFDSYCSTNDPSELDVLIYQVTKLFRMMRASELCSTQLLEAVGMGLSLLENVQDSQSSRSSYGYRPRLSSNHSRGRPRLEIPINQLEYLLELGFSCPQIATVLGVSLSTVRRRMDEGNLSISGLYSTITDDELDAIVMDIKVSFPNCGYRLMYGHLVTRGYRITQTRIREALRRVDPDGVAVRWATTIERRKYKVLSPLSLWHLDGNHKLIRCVFYSVYVDMLVCYI